MSENRFSVLAKANSDSQGEASKIQETKPLSANVRSTLEERDSNFEAIEEIPGAQKSNLEKMKAEQKPAEKNIPRVELAGSDIAEDFNCAVCFRLAVQPTTLSCGHTSCRVCLAQWYFSSKKKECPLCREKYQGHPKINTQLRNLLMRLVPNEMQMREKEMLQDGKGMKIVANFDKELSKETFNSPKKGYNFLTSFCSGIIVALSTVIVVYLTWFWQKSDNDLLVRKPVETWKPKDVESWLMEMPWALHYAHIAREKEIDGKFLLSLDVDSVQRLLNVTNVDELKALVYSINFLKKRGIKMPVNIWDYKAVYPGRSLFLLYSMRHFPRTSILYMWVYFYDELFLPFVQYTSQITQSNNSALEPRFSILEGETSIPQNLSIPEPTTAMLSQFIFYTIFMPQYPIIIFALQMFQYHTFTPMFAVVTAVFCSFLDILSLKTFFLDRNLRSIYALLKKHFQHLISAFMFMVLWPLIPRFIIDVIFYGTLYVSPVQLSVELYQRFRQP